MVTLDELARKIDRHGDDLREHIKEDYERHGQAIAALSTIQTDVKYLREKQESQEEKMETTGSHNVSELQKKADFWPKVIISAVVGLVMSGVTALVVFWATHK